MKILKYVGLIVLIIIAIPLISALFISKDYEVVEKQRREAESESETESEGGKVTSAEKEKQ